MTITDPFGLEVTVTKGFVAIEQTPKNCQRLGRLPAAKRNRLLDISNKWLEAEGFIDLAKGQIGEFKPRLTIPDIVGKDYPGLGDFKPVSDLLPT